MPVSKKKKHNKSRYNSPPAPKDKLVHMERRDKKGAVLAFANLCYPDFGSSPSDPDAVVNISSIRNDFALFKQENQNYLDQIKAGKGGPELVQKTEELYLATKLTIETMFDKYMKQISEFDQTLNIYEETENKYDTIDIRELIRETYGNKPDIIRQMNDILNAPDFHYDPSWTWSPSQYFTIQITDNLFYRCFRVLYNETCHSARYMVTEYRTLHAIAGHSITIPTLWFFFEITDGRFNLTEHTVTHEAITEHSDNFPYTAYLKGTDEHTTDTMEQIMRETYRNTYGECFNTLRINCGGILSLTDTMNWLGENKRAYKNNKAAYTLLTNFLKTTTAQNIYQEYARQSMDFTIHTHIITAASLIIATLVITNKRLKDKKLSRPVKASANIHYETEIILENKPDRKTRLLDDTIRITSETKPEIPTIERIIKYHTPEWERKSYLRHTKSGELKEVKGGICRRRCVDMTNIKNHQMISGTDYKLVNKPAPDKNDETLTEEEPADPTEKMSKPITLEKTTEDPAS